jgi:hypothetical protein
MNIEIMSAVEKGAMGNECIVLKVKNNTDNMGNYLLSDTTYLEDKTVSNELRHIYWFPNKEVAKGDYIVLYTGKGKNKSSMNNENTHTHVLYWNLNITVWNKDGDRAVLFNIKERTFTKV